MLCPYCHSKTTTKDTRERKGYVWRRHFCPSCLLVFTTHETCIKDYSAPRAYIRRR